MNGALYFQKLRRHGDVLRRSVGGYYMVQGRADDTMNLGGIKVYRSFHKPSLLSSFVGHALTIKGFCVQTSSVEIEHICNRTDEGVLETAAISVAPPNGGPEQLSIFVVLKNGLDIKPDVLRLKFSKAIQTNLNPLFKVWSSCCNKNDEFFASVLWVA